MSPKSHYPESATATRSLCGLYDAAADSDPRLVDEGATCLSCQRIQNIYAARQSTGASAGPVVKTVGPPHIVELLLLAAAAILVVALIGTLLQRVAQRRRASRRQLVTDAVSAGLARVRTVRLSRPISVTRRWR